MKDHLIMLGVAAITAGSCWAFSPAPIRRPKSGRFTTMPSMKHQHHNVASSRRGRMVTHPRIIIELKQSSSSKKRNRFMLSSAPTSSSHESSSTSSPSVTIDRVLSKLTSLFPLFVLGSAILGSYAPQTLNWVNDGNWISYMLSG
jgi:hypothetical protein